MCLRCLYVSKDKAEDRRSSAVITLKSTKLIESYGAIKQGSGAKCQDTFTIMPNLTQNTHFFSVYDGSGPLGYDVANKTESLMRGYIEKSYKRLETLKKSDEIKNYLKEAFKAVQEELETLKLSYDNTKSATSCVCCLVYGNTAFIANVGNCRAALSTTKRDGKRIPIDLSHDHTLDSKREKERCVREGIKISVGAPSSKTSILGPERLWFNDEGPGFTTTRALGCNKNGIIPDAEIVSFDIKDGDNFLVLGTDGLWDVLKSKDVLDIIDGIEQRKNASEELVKQARKVWETEYGNNEYKFVGDDISIKSPDDISVVLVYLNRS